MSIRFCTISSSCEETFLTHAPFASNCDGISLSKIKNQFASHKRIHYLSFALNKNVCAVPSNDSGRVEAHEQPPGQRVCKLQRCVQRHHDGQPCNEFLFVSSDQQNSDFSMQHVQSGIQSLSWATPTVFADTIIQPITAKNDWYTKDKTVKKSCAQGD